MLQVETRRNFDEEYFEKVKGYYELEAYKKAMRKRKVWSEPMFVEARQWHRMERVRLRMLEREDCEGLVTASGQNIKRLPTFKSHGPRRPAPAAVLRPSERPSLCLDHRRSGANFSSSRSHLPSFSTRCPKWYCNPYEVKSGLVRDPTGRKFLPIEKVRSSGEDAVVAADAQLPSVDDVEHQ